MQNQKRFLTTRIFCVTKRWKSRTHYISLSSNKLHERLIKTIKFTDELVWRIPPVPCTKLRLGTFQSTKPLSLSKWKSWGDILLSTEMQFLKLMFKCLARTQKMSDIQFEAVLKSFLQRIVARAHKIIEFRYVMIKNRVFRSSIQNILLNFIIPLHCGLEKRFKIIPMGKKELS